VTINKADLGVDISNKIEVVTYLKVLSDTKTISKSEIGKDSPNDQSDKGKTKLPPIELMQRTFVFDEFSRAIMAKIVKKCGSRDYWENWAGDVAKIAQTHITRIKALLEKPDTSERCPLPTKFRGT
jgi:predicted helicase